MKRLLIVCMLTMLSGCNLLPGSQPSEGETVATQLTALIVQGCSFVPTPGTVSSIVSAYHLEAGVAVALFEQAAKAVCDLVASGTAPRSIGAEATPRSYGTIKAPDGSTVEIKGNFSKLDKLE